MSSPLPSSAPLRALLLVGVVVLLGGVGLLVSTALEERRQVSELVSLRDSLAGLRAAADSCASELARAESAFRRFDAEVDSLRRSVEEYEGLDPQGVPQERYREYMQAFDRYNASVGDWEGRADSLRAREAACRALVERHNTLADTLRARAEAWGASTGG